MHVNPSVPVGLSKGLTLASRWYRMDNMTLIITGALIGAWTGLIKGLFGK